MAVDGWNNISVGEYGWIGRLLLTMDGVAEPLGSYDTLEFQFKPPSGAIRTRTAEFATDGSDGLLERVIADGDIDVPGNWRVRAHIARDTPPASLYSSWHRFKVAP